jgi:hypothetical protein
MVHRGYHCGDVRRTTREEQRGILKNLDRIELVKDINDELILTHLEDITELSRDFPILLG